LAADRSLAEERAARQNVEQSFQSSDEARANLAHDLESIQASLTSTAIKLASKSSTLDTVVIQTHEMELKLKATKEKLKAAKEKLETTNFDAKILRKDFMVDDTERASLVDSAYNTTHHFVFLYDFSALAESDDNNSPSAL
jgi:chromosome segregation ATPase